MNKLVRLAWILLFFSLPFWKGLSSVSLGVLVILAIYQLFSTQVGRIRLNWRSPFTGLALLFGLLALSLLNADFKDGMDVLYRNNYYITIPFCALVFQDVLKRQFDKIVGYFTLAVLLCSVIVWVFYFLSNEQIHWITEQILFLREFEYVDNELTKFGLYSPFVDRLQFGYLIVLAFHALCWKIYVQGIRVPDALKLLFLVATLLILGARGSQLGFFLSTMVWLIAFLNKYFYPKFGWGTQPVKRILLSGFLVISLFVILPLGAYKLIKPVSDRYNQMIWEIDMYESGEYLNYDYVHFTTLRRKLSWSYSWDLIKNSPITGVGVGDYRIELGVLYQKDGSVFPINIQNYWLYLWGVAGILAPLILIMTLIYWVKKISRDNQALGLWALAICIFYLIINLFDAVLIPQLGLMSFVLFFTILLLKSDALHSLD